MGGMNLSAIFLLVSFLVFVLALFGVQPGEVNMLLLGLSVQALGLFVFALGYRWPLARR